MQRKIGFVGAGNMATALITGILKSGSVSASELMIYEIQKEKCELMKAKGCLIADSIEALATDSRVIVLAVKPQNYPEVLAELGKNLSYDTVLVSLAAGISTQYIAEKVGKSCKVVRTMSNTPLMLGEGATAMCSSAEVEADELNEIVGFFEASGIVEILPEEQMNAIISVNGSSPAYFYLFAKAMVDYAVEQGIDQSVAMRMVVQTMKGSAKMLSQSGDTPEELIVKVSSPGGTTLKALEKFYEFGFEETVKQGMNACTQRANELGK